MLELNPLLPLAIEYHGRADKFILTSAMTSLEDISVKISGISTFLMLNENRLNLLITLMQVRHLKPIQVFSYCLFSNCQEDHWKATLREICSQGFVLRGILLNCFVLPFFSPSLIKVSLRILCARIRFSELDQNLDYMYSRQKYSACHWFETRPIRRSRTVYISAISDGK